MRAIQSNSFLGLVETSGMIDPKLMGSLVDRFESDHGALLTEIVSKGYMLKPDVGELWAQSIGSTYVDPSSMDLDHEAEYSLPFEMAQQICAIHLYEFGGYVTIAMADPKNSKLIESLERFLQYRVSPVFAFSEDIERAISVFYDLDISYEKALDSLEGASSDEMVKLTGKNLVELVESSELSSITNRMFLDAFRQRASDIHLESHEGAGLLRFRIDGKLRKASDLPIKVKDAVIVRLKFLAGMDIANSMVPQDGRFSMDLSSYKQDFRISSCPGLFGEKLVIRHLGGNGVQTVPLLDQLGLSQSNLERFRNSVSRPNGMFVVTGPTGSGKTTTLYSAINYLNDEEKNIMTIEDPVEYRLEGINHFEVNYRSGLDFKTILRSALRQDPDIILVGEIRDSETGRIAAEAALTGHLVLTTMHTSSAAQAILRFAEIGVDPYVLAPSLNGVMSQRLVGRICERCKYDYVPSDEVLSRYFVSNTVKAPVFYGGKGCRFCQMTGFSGRVAIHEVIEISEQMRTLISNRAAVHELQQEANRIGSVSLRIDGLMKVLQGVTTIDEVERVTVPEYCT